MGETNIGGDAKKMKEITQKQRLLTQNVKKQCRIFLAGEVALNVPQIGRQERVGSVGRRGTESQHDAIWKFRCQGYKSRRNSLLRVCAKRIHTTFLSVGSSP